LGVGQFRETAEQAAEVVFSLSPLAQARGGLRLCRLNMAGIAICISATIILAYSSA